MTRANKLKQKKIILLAILMLSSIFLLGCSIKGDEPSPEQSILRYSFVPGKYIINSSNIKYMFYAGVNQEKGSGYIIDTKGNPIAGSSFSQPMNKCFDNNGSPMWIADGFYDMKDNNEYPPGTYSLKLNCKDSLINKNLYWDGIPTWNEVPQIRTGTDIVDAQIYGVTETERSKGLSVSYRIKFYVADRTDSKLYYQSKVAYPKNNKDYTYVSCTLPRRVSQSSIKLIPMIVAELYNSNGIQMVIFTPGTAFSY